MTHKRSWAAARARCGAKPDHDNFYGPCSECTDEEISDAERGVVKWVLEHVASEECFSCLFPCCDHETPDECLRAVIEKYDTLDRLRMLPGG